MQALDEASRLLRYPAVFEYAFCIMTTWTLEEAQRDLSSAAQKALGGEEVGIRVGGQLLRLVRDVSSRLPGYFAECYSDAEDALIEERICHDSKPVLET